MAKFKFLKEEKQTFSIAELDFLSAVERQHQEFLAQLQEDAIEPESTYQTVQFIMMPLSAYSVEQINMVKRGLALKIFNKLMEDGVFQFNIDSTPHQDSFTVRCNLTI